MKNMQMHRCPLNTALQRSSRSPSFPRAHAIASIDVGDSVDLKRRLRKAVQVAGWSLSTREKISELQVALESVAGELDYGCVQGLWKLLYTTAPDVVPLMLDQKLATPRFPWQPRVSSIYQRFTSADEGIVQNIVQFGDGVLFDKQKGATFVVNASWFRSSEAERTIELAFDSAQVCTLTPTPALEAFLAPPILPRTTIQHQLLLGLAEFDVRIPLPTPSNLSKTSGRITGKYKLTYCDATLLIGRAEVGGGVFIFDRAHMSALW